MIAEDDRGGIAQGANAPQHFQGVRAAVHQIAHEPHGIAIGRELQRREQRAEFRVAALHVADRIQRHQAPPGSSAALRASPI